MGEALVYPGGRLVFGSAVFRAATGRGGVRTDKREGDGATPVGLMTLRRLLYRADRMAPPPGQLRREPIGRGDGWCDDPADPAYNTQIRLPHPAGHEELWRDDALYDLIGVLGWNDAPPERGRGSAIFLHVATPDYAPTAGCVALAKPDLLRLLAGGMDALRVLEEE